MASGSLSVWWTRAPCRSVLAPRRPSRALPPPRASLQGRPTSSGLCSVACVPCDLQTSRGLFCVPGPPRGAAPVLPGSLRPPGPQRAEAADSGGGRRSFDRPVASLLLLPEAAPGQCGRPAVPEPLASQKPCQVARFGKLRKLEGFENQYVHVCVCARACTCVYVCVRVCAPAGTRTYLLRLHPRTHATAGGKGSEPAVGLHPPTVPRHQARAEKPLQWGLWCAPGGPAPTQGSGGWRPRAHGSGFGPRTRV